MVHTTVNDSGKQKHRKGLTETEKQGGNAAPE